MTEDEFITGYCERSKFTWEELSKYIVALPCACGEPECKGWAMVSKDPHMVQWHMDDLARTRARGTRLT